MEADTTLALQRHEPFVDDAGLHHVSVQRERFVEGEPRVVLFVQRAVFVQHAHDVVVGSGLGEGLCC